jgi:hypothetical protein
MKNVAFTNLAMAVLVLGCLTPHFINTASGQQDNATVWGYDPNEVSGEELFEEKPTRSPEAEDALNLTADLIAQYAKLLQSGNRDAYMDFRHYKLDPAIRNVSALALQTRDTELLYSAIALASCDDQGENKGEFWSPALAKAIRAFPKKDTEEAMSRLGRDGRERVRKSILAYLPANDDLRPQFAKPKEEEDLDFLGQ